MSNEPEGIRFVSSKMRMLWNILLCCYEDKPSPFIQLDSCRKWDGACWLWNQFRLFNHQSLFTVLPEEGSVRLFSSDKTISKLPKTEQECPERRKSELVREGIGWDKLQQSKWFVTTSPWDNIYYCHIIEWVYSNKEARSCANHKLPGVMLP